MVHLVWIGGTGILQSILSSLILKVYHTFAFKPITIIFGEFTNFWMLFQITCPIFNSIDIECLYQEKICSYPVPCSFRTWPIGQKTLKRWKHEFWRLIEIALVNSHLLYKLKPDNESVSQKQFRLNLCHSLVQPLFTLRENLEARAVRGPGCPPIPSDRLMGKHFGQRADKRRRCKVCAYTKNAQGNLKHTKTNFYCAKCDAHLCEHPCF